MGQLTVSTIAPYILGSSTVFSLNLPISGAYLFSNPSSSWSDERRASAYAEIIRRWGWAMAKVRTVSFAWNRISKEPLCFPITTGSVLFDQLCGDSVINDRLGTVNS